MIHGSQARTRAIPCGAGLLPGLFLWLLCWLPAGAAGWGEADWLAGRWPTTPPGDRDAATLAHAARSGDAATLVSAARSLDRPGTTAWVRREALRLLAQHFCITDQPDSLLRRQDQLLLLTGSTFPCDGQRPAASVVIQTPPATRWCLQLGAFSSRANAQKHLQALKGRGIPVRVVKEGRFHRALAGDWGTEAEARRMAAEWSRQRWITDWSVREAP